MRVEAILWVGATAYFVMITIVYAAVGGDVAGGIALAAAAIAGGLVAGWSWTWRRRHGTRASDRVDGDVADEHGVIGRYPSASLRPLGLAAGMTGIVLGVAVGLWMVLAGLAIVASQAALMVRDEDT